MNQKQWQLTEVPVAGVDTRSDPVLVASPKVLAADNVSLATPGRARKRNGTKQRAKLAKVSQLTGNNFCPRTVDVKDARWVTSEISGKVLAHVDNLLLAESQGQLLARGYLDQMRLSFGRPQWDSFNPAGPMLMCDLGVAGDVAVLAFLSALANRIQIGLYDLATGMLLHPIFAPSVSRTLPRVVSIPATGGALVFFCDAGTNLYAMPIPGAQARNTQWARVSTITPPLVAADMNGTRLYDVAVLGSRVVVTYYNAGGNIARMYVNAAGGVEGAVQTDAPAGVPVVLAISPTTDANGRLLIAWASDAGNTLKARDYNTDATLSANAAITTIDTLTSYKGVAIGVRSATWTILYETGGAALHNRVINRAEWLTSGAPTLDAIALRHASLSSKMWLDATTTRWYVVVTYESQTQPSAQVTYFVYAVKGTDAALDPGIFEEQSFVLVGMFWPGFAGGVTSLVGFAQIGYLPAVTVTGRTARLGLLYRSEQTSAGAIKAARSVTIEHAPADMQPAVQGPDGASYVPGGLLWRIDDTLNGSSSKWSTSEAGFTLDPENVTAIGAGGGSLTPSSSYAFRFMYRDFTTGERSTVLGSFVFATGAAQGTLNLTIPTLTHTLRQGVVIDVFRQVANAVQGAPYFYEGSVPNDPNSDTVAFASTLDDLTLQSRRRDYLTLGEVDEVAPPACSCIAFGQGRGALSGFDEDGSVWLTKQRGSGEPVRWSDLLLAQADHPVPGRPTALAWNGTDLIVFRARSIQVLSGRGPDNTGAATNPMEPAGIVSCEVGCRSARSLVRIPDGWLFQAVDGTYWQLGLDGKLLYIGADVETFTDDCRGAFTVQNKKQARFVTASRTLVYHYDTGMWAPWTLGAISAASLPDGTGLYLPSSASALILQDDAAGFKDNGAEYQMRVRPAWFRPQGIQGEFDVRRILINGGMEGAHRPLARIYYDYEPGFNECAQWTADTVVGTIVQGDGTSVFGGNSRLNVATQVYEFAIPVGRERCMAVAIELLDVPVGGTQTLGASFWITAVAYEWSPVEFAGGAGYRLEQARLAQ